MTDIDVTACCPARSCAASRTACTTFDCPVYLANVEAMLATRLAEQKRTEDAEAFNRQYRATGRVLDEIRAERARQTKKHGDQSHLPDGTGPELKLRAMPVYGSPVPWGRAFFLAKWARNRCKAASQNEGGDGSITFEHILTEEWAEAIAEDDPAKLRAELLQVAAVAVQWIEAIDRRVAQR